MGHGFWSTGQDAFFYVRVFYPNVSSNRSMTIPAAYRKHELTEKREYAQRVREVEHGVFTPLVLSATGGMGREAVTFWWMEFPGRSENHIRLSWGGFVVVSLLHPPLCHLPSYASVEAGPLTIAQLMNSHYISCIRGSCSV